MAVYRQISNRGWCDGKCKQHQLAVFMNAFSILLQTMNSSTFPSEPDIQTCSVWPQSVACTQQLSMTMVVRLNGDDCKGMNWGSR